MAELTLERDGQTLLKFARAYGFRNIQNVVRRLKSGKSPYHFVVRLLQTKRLAARTASFPHGSLLLLSPPSSPTPTPKYLSVPLCA